jgi:hypothetical protein
MAAAYRPANYTTPHTERIFSVRTAATSMWVLVRTSCILNPELQESTTRKRPNKSTYWTGCWSESMVKLISFEYDITSPSLPSPALLPIVCKYYYRRLHHAPALNSISRLKVFLLAIYHCVLSDRPNGIYFGEMNWVMKSLTLQYHRMLTDCLRGDYRDGQTTSDLAESTNHMGTLYCSSEKITPKQST